jgi:AcrR family transcriptional regulator
VLEAGLELFGENGYEAASIAEIGRRAGIAKSVLYHYFGSKSALYAELLESQSAELLAAVAAAVPADAEAPRLRAGVDAYLGFLAERPAAWRLLLRDPPTDPGLRGLHDRLADERMAALAELLATRAKRATAPSHVHLLGVAVRVFATWWYDHRDVPREHVVDLIVDLARSAAQRLAPQDVRTL